MPLSTDKRIRVASDNKPSGASRADIMLLVFLAAGKLPTFCVAGVCRLELSLSSAQAFPAIAFALRVCVHVVAAQFVAPLAMAVLSAVSVHLNCHGFKVERVTAMANFAKVVGLISFGNRADVILISKSVRA